MRVTSELALACGVAFSLLFWIGGSAVINAFILDSEAREAALAYLPWCAVVPVIGVAAWQLDGLFLGTTQGPAVRNAGMLALGAYLITDLALVPAWGNAGVWTAFLMSYFYRAGALALYWPRLMDGLVSRRAG